MTRLSPHPVPLLLAGLLALGGCSAGKESGNAAAGAAKDDAPANASSGLQPCALLAADQVGTVLPEHDEGFVAKAGGSLIEGVDAYQCSYSSPGTDLLTVILNVAVDDDRFKKIKPSSFGMSDAQKIDVADGGWLRGDDDDMKVTALKGRTVIDLELMAPGARQKSDALVELARQVAAKVP